MRDGLNQRLKNMKFVEPDDKFKKSLSSKLKSEMVKPEPLRLDRVAYANIFLIFAIIFMIFIGNLHTGGGIKRIQPDNKAVAGIEELGPIKFEFKTTKGEISYKEVRKICKEEF